MNTLIESIAVLILLWVSLGFPERLAAQEIPGRAASASAEPPQEQCSGFLYRAKRDGVPVFDRESTTGTVLRQLKLGEEVCKIGEQGEFAVLDWSTEHAANSKNKLAFARSVELWEPARGPQPQAAPDWSPVGIFERAKRYLSRMGSGTVPEDPLAPYRPILDSWNATTNDNGGDCARGEDGHEMETACTAPSTNKATMADSKKESTTQTDR